MRFATYFEIVLGEDTVAPLALSCSSGHGADLHIVDPIGHEVGEGVQRAGIRAGCKGARVGEISQFTVIAWIEAVLLIAEKSAAKLQQMAAMLPGEVIRISENIVDEYLRRWVGAEAAGIIIAWRGRAAFYTVKRLQAETSCLLRIAGDANDLIAVEPEDAAGICGIATVKANASIICSELIHNSVRKGMHPTGIEEMIRIVAGGWELDRNWIRGLTIARVSL